MARCTDEEVISSTENVFVQRRVSQPPRRAPIRGLSNFGNSNWVPTRTVKAECTTRTIVASNMLVFRANMVRWRR